MRDVVENSDGAEAVFGGSREVGDFTMEATSKMFSIVIDKLYSDPPRACIRELMTNAFDSHIAAGCPTRPVKLLLPTRWDPSFSVRDFGTSLSHKDVMGLYTRVGVSTKDQSNEQVGKWGLGSKVPFACVDTFGVTCWLEGEKRVYSCFKSQGKPKIMHMNTSYYATIVEKNEALDVMLAHGFEATDIATAFEIDLDDENSIGNFADDEERGLEVSFPVAERDVASFTTAAKRVVFGFPVAPESNMNLLADSDVEPSMVGDDWKMYHRDYDLGLSGFLVRQGCVLYPVDRAAITNKVESQAVRALSGEAIVLDMPIGSVEVTPARESLSYDDTTVANLVAAIEKVFEVFVRNANKEVSEQKCLLDAYGARARVLGGIENTTLRDAVARTLTWRGRRITTSSLQLSQDRIKLLTKHGLHMYQFDASEGSRRRRHSSDKQERIRALYSLEVTPNTLPTFIYYTGDSPTYILHRLRAAQSKLGGRGSNLILLRNFDPMRDARLVKLLYVSLGRPAPVIVDGVPTNPLQFTDLTTLDFEKPDYQRTLADCVCWNERYGSFKKDHYGSTPAVPDPDQDDVYYLHTARGVPLSGLPGSSESSTSTLNRIWDEFKKMGFIPKSAVLVGIPASRKDIAKRIPSGWSFFGDLVQEVFDEHYDPRRAGELVALSQLASDRSAGQIKAFFTALNEHETQITDKNSESIDIQIRMLPFLDAESDQQQLTLYYMVGDNAWLDRAQKTKFAEEFKANDHLVKEFWGLVKEHRRAYPLLARLSAAPTAGDWDCIMDYINLRDAKAAPTRDLRSAAQRDMDARAIADFENEGGFSPREDEVMPVATLHQTAPRIVVAADDFPVDMPMAA
jgi:hypothetical protein